VWLSILQFDNIISYRYLTLLFKRITITYLILCFKTNIRQDEPTKWLMRINLISTHISQVYNMYSMYTYITLLRFSQENISQLQVFNTKPCRFFIAYNNITLIIIDNCLWLIIYLTLISAERPWIRFYHNMFIICYKSNFNISLHKKFHVWI